MPSNDFPVLNTPVEDPVSFGAVAYATLAAAAAGTDSTTAIQSALNAGGDVQFTHAGIYLVNAANNCTPSGGSTISVPANKTIEAAPGINVTLYAPTLCNSGHNVAVFELGNSGDRIINLTFQGGNSFGNAGATCTGSGGPCQVSANAGQFLVWPVGNNFVIEGDTFQNSFGDSAVQVYGGSSTPPSGWTVKYNTFTNNPYFGLNVEGAASTNGALSGGALVTNNYQQDGIFGSEFDNCPNPTTMQQYVTYQYNEVITSIGDCSTAGSSGCDTTSGPVASDSATSCQVTTNLFKCNYSQGTSLMAGRIRLNNNGGLPAGFGPAQAQNNMFGASIDSTCDTTGCDSSQTLAQNQATCGAPFASTNPSLGTCASAVGTAALTISLTDIASGQALVVFHKGISTDPTLSDSLLDTFTTATVSTSSVNSASGGCLNFDYVATPGCTSFPCSDTITISDAGTSLNNSATVCEVNNWGGIDALGGSPYTAGDAALSGPITPLSSTDLVLASYYLETPNSFSQLSQNYIGTGTPSDIGAATLSNGTLLVGAATEPGVASSQVGLERSTQTPVISVAPSVGSSAALTPQSKVKLNIFVFPGA